MFERYKGLINIENFLKEEYEINQFDESSMMKQPFISYEGSGSSAQFWIKDKEGDAYLFKSSDKYPYSTLYGELISKKIADMLGIPCADVRACSFKGKIGILSKKITKENETIINGGEVIQDVLNNYSLINEGKSYLAEESFLTDTKFKELYDIPDSLNTLSNRLKIKYIYNNLNNLDQLWSIIDLYFKHHNRSVEERISIVDYLVKVFIFDVIMMQCDRHIENWGIIHNPDMNKLSPCPLYDNAGVLGLDYTDLHARINVFNDEYKAYLNYPTDKQMENFSNYLYDKNRRLLLTVSADDIKNAKGKIRKNNIKVLSSFLKVTSSIYNTLLCDYISKISNFSISELLNQIQLENNIHIPEDISDYIVKTWTCNLQFIKNTMNSYGLKVDEKYERRI